MRCVRNANEWWRTKEEGPDNFARAFPKKHLKPIFIIMKKT